MTGSRRLGRVEDVHSKTLVDDVGVVASDRDVERDELHRRLPDEQGRGGIRHVDHLDSLETVGDPDVDDLNPGDLVRDEGPIPRDGDVEGERVRGGGPEDPGQSRVRHVDDLKTGQAVRDVDERMGDVQGE